MSKQDRQAPRTPAALEQKYQFGKSFAEMFGLVTDAQNAADQAQEAANRVDKSLTQQEIFNRLTNNGEDQGLYLEDGKIYFNAQYIMSHTFTAQAEVFLEPGLEEIETIIKHYLGMETIPSDRIALYDFNNDGLVNMVDATACLQAMSRYNSLAEWSGAVKSTVTVTIDAGAKALTVTGTNMWGREIEYFFGAEGASIGTLYGNVAVMGKLSVGCAVTFEGNGSEAKMSIGFDGTPKSISWKDNGDGTYTLIGR